METHILVPKHEVLSPEEAKIVLEHYEVTREELPKIKKDDPALEEFKVRVDDVIKITRKGPTANESIYYRVVISD